MAYVNHPSSWGAEESSEVVFSEYETPNARNSHALCEVCADKRWHCVHSCLPSNIAPLSLVCQVRFDHQICISSTKLIFFSNLLQNINFTNPFYEPPVVLTTVLNGRNNRVNVGSQAKGPLVSWLEVYRLIVHFLNCYGCRGYAKKFDVNFTERRRLHLTLDKCYFHHWQMKLNDSSSHPFIRLPIHHFIPFYIYTCIHPCVRAYMHIYTHAYTPMYVWMYGCMLVYMHECMHVCMSTCMYCIHAWKHTWMHTCIHVSICIHQPVSLDMVACICRSLITFIKSIMHDVFLN